MNRIEFTLLTDGSSDSVLIHPLLWLLEHHLREKMISIDGTWADLRRLDPPPKKLADRVSAALDLYPCDILFVHRDAEGQEFSQRIEEIASATQRTNTPSIPIVPIRMQEAWLLIDESALRRAAGNPRGRAILRMPKISQLESIPNPKELLHQLLLDASEFHGRRLRKIRPTQQAWRLGELITDYSPLLQLSAFRHAEESMLSTLRQKCGLDI